ncbi:hypothetical protein QR680_002315 [Steinernema hermaphroditum]|uniref:V-type proton ATPase subunit S1/VOA1 transmembrane domain-containing protein n=1 Tax=Steinernema hermaphroditum TaxID=289476 RepID=A0AA39H341_9BILA|nr:hypothetical protein QR680_002315 [Steinernema hermaphroditum]
MRVLLCLTLLVVLCAAKKKKAHQASVLAQAAAPSGKSYDFPIVLPAYHKDPSISVKDAHADYGNCLLYLEGVTVIVEAAKKTPKYVAASIGFGSDNGTQKYQFDPSYVKCVHTSRDQVGFNATKGLYTFTVAINVDKLDGKYGGSSKFTVHDKLIFDLVFNMSIPKYWELSKVTLKELHLTRSGDYLDGNIDFTTSVDGDPKFMKVNSVLGYGYGCSDTQGVFFTAPNNKDYSVGIALHNFQVELFGLYRNAEKDIIKFSRDVNDCVPTFSVGSSMGIVVAVVLASILMFGFLMLNSVQTMDRFDDPKQKQILINVRE